MTQQRSDARVGLVLGTMTFGESVFSPDVEEMLRTFFQAGYRELDTAYVYNNGECERLLGQALKSFSDTSIRVSTKVNPRISGKLDADAAYKQLNESLERLQLESVDTFYLHFPDPKTPVRSVLEACGALHREGKFRELGLSNFPAWLVADVYWQCKENGWVLPTVYEGVYNPLSRAAERELNDALNYFGLRFYAYNPMAGGMLTGRYKNFCDAPTDGRFTHRPNYQQRYWKESYFQAVESLDEVCQSHGLTLVSATYRWLVHHSMLNGSRGDAIIIGASKKSHLEQNIAAAQDGALPEDVVTAFQIAWRMCQQDSPEYFRFYGGGAK
ncbi:MAG: aldo/keto reductase [Planctomycetia bacterium]|nr:aldo/keto reductase [Planctomycetia bacterium]